MHAVTPAVWNIGSNKIPLLESESYFGPRRVHPRETRRISPGAPTTASAPGFDNHGRSHPIGNNIDFSNAGGVQAMAFLDAKPCPAVLRPTADPRGHRRSHIPEGVPQGPAGGVGGGGVLRRGPGLDGDRFRRFRPDWQKDRLIPVPLCCIAPGAGQGRFGDSVGAAFGFGPDSPRLEGNVFFAATGAFAPPPFGRAPGPYGPPVRPADIQPRIFLPSFAYRNGQAPWQMPQREPVYMAF
jgi:hypothetical protein